MLALREKRLKGEIPDQLLLLEHPPVITSGRREASDDLKETPDSLLKKGIDLLETDRGGKLTYHGPGQLVGYFVFSLKSRGDSIEKFVWKAEEGIRLFLQDYAIEGERDPKNPGIWIGPKKIASLGFHIHQGISTHGISLNLDMDLKPFSYFTPCGIPNSQVTSVLQETGKSPTLESASRQLANYYSTVFESELTLNPSKPSGGA